MANDELPRGRVPVAPIEPGYPTLTQVRVDRRRLLKLAALSTVSGALGLTLTGCPSDGSGNGGGGGPDYVPWDGPEHLAGAAPPAYDAPMAVVIGGGPIAVTFKDGATADLVVAGVLQPMFGSDVTQQLASKAQEHAALVRAAMAEVPSSTLGDAAALDALEEKLRQALSPTINGGTLQEVSAAKARAEEAPPPPSPPPPSEGQGASAPSAPAPPSAPSAASAAPDPSEPPRPASAPPVPQGASAVGARKLWTPCRRPGCTTCGPK